MVLPYIDMNPPQVCMCSPSWTHSTFLPIPSFWVIPVYQPQAPLVPLITQQQYILPRDVVWNLFSLANLVPKLSQNICLEKRPNEAYADFLARLETAIFYNVIKKETKIQNTAYLWKYKSGMSKTYHFNSWDWDYYWLFEGLSPFRIKQTNKQKPQKIQMLTKTMATT